MIATDLQELFMQKPGANAALIELVDDDNNSGIVKATALTLFAAPFSEDVANVIRRELESENALIRIAALRAVEQFEPEFRPDMAASLLDDPVRAVRLQSVTTLSPAQASMRQVYRERFDAAKLEFIDAQLVNAERPESHINLGNLYAAGGETEKAEQSYLLALGMEPHAVPARINLADLYRQLQRDVDAEQLLRDGIALDEDSAVLHHSLGMVLVRSEQPATALTELARAVELDSGNRRYTYVYAIALNSYGDRIEAIAVLETARKLFPGDFDIAWALATMYRDAGRTADAKAEANRLLGLYPGHQRVRMLLDSL
jgi:tetratricopeptide (TPR) repeat protein